MGGSNLDYSIEKRRAYNLVNTFPNLISSNFSAQLLRRKSGKLTSFEKFVDAQLKEEKSVVECFIVSVFGLAIVET